MNAFEWQEIISKHEHARITHRGEYDKERLPIFYCQCGYGFKHFTTAFRQSLWEWLVGRYPVNEPWACPQCMRYYTAADLNDAIRKYKRD